MHQNVIENESKHSIVIARLTNFKNDSVFGMAIKTSLTNPSLKTRFLKLKSCKLTCRRRFFRSVLLFMPLFL